MLRPSTAPLWKTATRIFLRAVFVSADAVLTKNFGMTPKPISATAPDFMRARRVISLSISA
jgi:hypothetical protein